MEKRKSQLEYGQPIEQTRGLFCTCHSGVTTPVPHLAYELDVRSEFHWQVSLAAVNQICVIHETMNGCENRKIH